jgi:acyl carrier protein
MEKNEIPPRLQDVFNRIFKDKSIQLSDLTSAKDIDGWDSFTHLTLIQEIENEFKIEFQMRELMTMSNVGDMTRIIIGKFQ